MSGAVLIGKAGGLGHISLNRPEALHSLTHAMCESMTRALLDWRDDDDVAAIIIDHAPAPDGDPKSSRGFCAGGDINLLRHSAMDDGGETGRAFFRSEYQLNHLLFTYPKPVAAFMDGITMGGGVGISLPASLRVATENTRLAMPETGIGLFPDVGGGWYLSRLAGHLGAYLALTSDRMNGADCIHAGLATHYLPAAALPDAKRDIACKPDQLAAILDRFSAPPGPAPHARNAAAIAHHFAHEKLEDILASLAADGGEWAARTGAVLAGKCPTSCKVALRQIGESLGLSSFADNMAMEFRLASRMLMRSDFAEGVRAIIVDKTNDPAWQPARPEDVDQAMIEAVFAPLPQHEEWKPL